MAKNYYASGSYGNRLGGKRWDDGTFSGVRKITMTATDHTLNSLKVTYALEGYDPSVRMKDFGGFTHGGDGHQRKEFTLDYPREYLTKMSGYMGMAPPPNKPDDRYYVVKSLSFHTNQRTLGPCGPQEGTPFETEVDGVIVGFFGSSAGLLDSVGAYMLVD